MIRRYSICHHGDQTWWDVHPEGEFVSFLDHQDELQRLLHQHVLDLDKLLDNIRRLQENHDTYHRVNDFGLRTISAHIRLVTKWRAVED